LYFNQLHEKRGFMQRIFIGFSLPDNVKDHLRSQCHSLSTNWVKPENMHVTLCFLGEVDRVSYRTLLLELEQINLKKFTLKTKGIGYSKAKKGPRVIWAGIERSKSIEQLKEQIDTVLEELGINFDKREFHPHITLARPQDVLYDDFNKYLNAVDMNTEIEFAVESYQVFSSQNTEDGLSYTIEGQYQLS